MKRKLVLVLALVAILVLSVGLVGCDGARGPVGLRGEQGPQGVQGEQGVQGVPGVQGEKGDKGDAGLQGEQGATGAKGDKGELGPVGATGAQGAVGAVGPAGLNGSMGLKGDKGDTGDTGPQGVQGDAGSQGIQGEQGLMGPRGPQGEQGERGWTGPTGAVGPQGAIGPVGPQGDEGPQGVQGEQGIQGDQGIPGDIGPQGVQGEQGPQGIQGDVGPQGPQGPQGVQGPAGPAGADGYPPPPVFDTKLDVAYWTGSGFPNTIAAAEMVNMPTFTGLWAAHLTTGAERGAGDTATISLSPVSPMTLGDVLTIAWKAYSVSGYPPHVDIMLDLDGSSTWTAADDALVIEYAYNSEAHYLMGGTDYGVTHNVWFSAFADDVDGSAVVDGTANAWATRGSPGPLDGSDPNFIYRTLADWKLGVTYDLGGTIRTVDADSLVLRLDIEVDNWIPGSDVDAYVDDIVINGTPVFWVP